MKKQAILIIAHNNFHILESIIKILDYKGFDFYIHIDKKVKDFDFKYYENLVKESNIYFVKRNDIKWATYSQINCELELLKESTKKSYKYYHMISGVDMPLKKGIDIYKYFDKSNKEYVAYTSLEDVNEETLDRIKYYHFFNSYRRSDKKLLIKIYYNLLRLQRIFKVNRVKNVKNIRKGANWFSITDSFAKYVITKEKEIKKMYKHTNCGDEIFMQTILYNSKYFSKLNNESKDEHINIKRYIDWNRGEPYTFKSDDLDELINSGMFFARKFDERVDSKVIDSIYKIVMGKEND